MDRHQRLLPVLTFMQEHLPEKLTVEELAHYVHLSVPHFHALFKDSIGRTPMQHLKHLRLARAAELLDRDDAPLAAIAAATGFCNEYHLSRDFSRAFGQAPGAWRRDPRRAHLA
jgi:transcriptional regulator GlxA family with amidase domain